MSNIFHRRACEFLDTCDGLKIPKVFPKVPWLPDSTMSEVERVLKIGYGTSVVDMFKEIGDNEELLPTVISYLVATNKVNPFVNPRIDEHFHGFNDQIRDLFNFSVGKDDVDVAAIHDIAQLSAQAFDEKEEENGNYTDCCNAVSDTIKAVGTYYVVGGAAGVALSTVVAGVMVADSAPLARMACRRIFPEH
ncbi:hypothetical protein WAZ07_11790 [Bacillus sp. FJAT-51639]|uniref:Uncharacterized protein n=1 Tax=Bacillus bruguierae TaxID=3127667 RepID=A0ABU8FJA3_9BACI